MQMLLPVLVIIIVIALVYDEVIILLRICVHTTPTDVLSFHVNAVKNPKDFHLLTEATNDQAYLQ